MGARGRAPLHSPGIPWLKSPAAHTSLITRGSLALPHAPRLGVSEKVSARGSSLGSIPLLVDRHACGQERVKRIEADPENCRCGTIVSSCFEGQSCVVLSQAFEPFHHLDSAVMRPKPNAFEQNFISSPSLLRSFRRLKPPVGAATAPRRSGRMHRGAGREEETVMWVAGSHREECSRECTHPWSRLRQSRIDTFSGRSRQNQLASFHQIVRPQRRKCRIRLMRRVRQNAFPVALRANFMIGSFHRFVD